MFDRQTLVKGLSFSYRTMVASEALLEFAIPRATGELKEYYKRHLEEERGHEKMLERDLRELGVPEIPESFAAACLAGAQYYFIAHEHPSMLLGYMHAMERNEISPQVVDDLCKWHGVNLTCLKHHASHDKGHKADLEGMIERLPEKQRRRVLWNEINVRDFLEKSLS